MLVEAFVLHIRKYKETSLIVEFFTKTSGRITCIAKGARRRKSNFSGILQPFVPLLISWKGRTELQTLIYAEQSRGSLDNLGRNVFSGYYINELLLKTIAKEDPHISLFEHYEYFLQSLNLEIDKVEFAIRVFEDTLVRELGYNLELDIDSSGKKIVSDKFYNYIYEQGFEESDKDDALKGSSILSLYNRVYEKSASTDLKRLMRTVLRRIIDKDIHTRKVYSELLEYMK